MKGGEKENAEGGDKNDSHVLGRENGRRSYRRAVFGAQRYVQQEIVRSGMVFEFRETTLPGGTRSTGRRQLRTVRPLSRTICAHVDRVGQQ